MNIIKATKKPVEVEATHWDGTIESRNHALAWIGYYGSVAEHQAERLVPGPPGTRGMMTKPQCIVIHTLEGKMEAQVGDYIIRGVEGEFYPCKPDIFEKTYTVEKL